MSHELICCWLELSPDAWPPDHYRLLGLKPGEDDVALIERRVHQRLDTVRRYQMMHPEQATEAMNRLAQAFVCLTEPATKKAYDLALLGERARPAASSQPASAMPALAPASPPTTTALAAPRDPLVWLYTPNAGPRGPLPPPPPVRARILPPPPPELASPLPPPEPPPEPVDTVVKAAQTSPQAQRGLATKRALYHRVARTRQLLRLWHRNEKYFAEPQKSLSKQEAGELYKLGKELEEALEDFPLLGEAGQPGYLIAALRQLDKAGLQALTFSQRESLNRDWKTGLKFLLAHRDFLRGELRAFRRRSWTKRMIHAMRAYLNEQPLAALLLLLALAAATVAVWRSYAVSF